jgi:hypothetical protein
MADGDKVSGEVGDTTKEEGAVRSTNPTSRRPYIPPHLRYLGSVRDLTSAGTSGLLDGGGRSQEQN